MGWEATRLWVNWRKEATLPLAGVGYVPSRRDGVYCGEAVARRSWLDSFSIYLARVPLTTAYIRRLKELRLRRCVCTCSLFETRRIQGVCGFEGRASGSPVMPRCCCCIVSVGTARTHPFITHSGRYIKLFLLVCTGRSAINVNTCIYYCYCCCRTTYTKDCFCIRVGWGVSRPLKRRM